jgi:Glutamate 5-kinase
VLVTEDDFSDLKRYSILRQTFERLLKLGAVPIVNENDTVTNIYTEQAPVFRDNDRSRRSFSASSMPTLWSCSPTLTAALQPNGDLANATVVTMVTEITAAIRDSARGTQPPDAAA